MIRTDSLKSNIFLAKRNGVLPSFNKHLSMEHLLCIILGAGDTVVNRTKL